MSKIHIILNNEYAADIVYSYLHSNNALLLHSKDKNKVIFETKNVDESRKKYLMDNIKLSKIPMKILEEKGNG